MPKRIIYVEKSFRDRPSIFNELRWMMTARAKGEVFNPMKCHKRKGERGALITITKEVLFTDTPLPVFSWPQSPIRKVPDNVSTYDGKPIGWYVKQLPKGSGTQTAIHPHGTSAAEAAPKPAAHQSGNP